MMNAAAFSNWSLALSLPVSGRLNTLFIRKKCPYHNIPTTNIIFVILYKFIITIVTNLGFGFGFSKCWILLRSLQLLELYSGQNNFPQSALPLLIALSRMSSSKNEPYQALVSQMMFRLRIIPLLNTINIL